MSYTLEDFATDCRNALRADPGQSGQEKVLDFVRKALLDEEFVATNVPASLPEDRNVIYRDEELGFLICAHNNTGAKKGYPHDHGSTWAIYGQAVGYTDMSEFDRLDNESKKGIAELKMVSEYRLTPGFAGMFGPRQIHAIHFVEGSRFIRITGTDLSRITTRKFDMVEGTVAEVAPTSGSLGAGENSA